jgi:N-acetylmuramoyl-L-alanine amidase
LQAVSTVINKTHNRVEIVKKIFFIGLVLPTVQKLINLHKSLPKKQNIWEVNMKNKKLSAIILLMTAVLLLTVISTVITIEDAGVADAAVLKQGSRGSTVRTVQTKLKNWGYYKGSVDGIYGPQTVSAVKYFQRRNGLAVDGIVGKRTASAMGVNLSSSTSSGGVTSSDLNLLARVVYGEARGEPYTGQVAVAAVVLNRMKSASFPNTIAGVIYQSGAFDCVADGQINLTPNATAKKAAQDALNGWDPTYGCLYYYNPKTATNKWMLSRPVKLSIGNHAFC